MRVSIPFRPFFRASMLAGIKVMTCRTKPYGTPGDTFKAFGATFRLTHVMRMTLAFVVLDCFEQEGCRASQELIDIWKSIHPTKGYDPDQIVWAHCFVREAVKGVTHDAA